MSSTRCADKLWIPQTHFFNGRITCGFTQHIGREHGFETDRELECLFSLGKQHVSLSLHLFGLIVLEVGHIISSFLVLS